MPPVPLCSEQILTRRYSRRLVTMEKIKQYDKAEAVAYHLAQGEPTMAIDRIHEIVYEPGEGKSGGSTPKGGKGEGGVAADIRPRAYRGKAL